MSEDNYLLQRRREQRLQRFGLVLGLGLAVVLHAMLFWGPEVEYRPALERAQVRRVLVAQPYRPAAVPTPRPAPVVEVPAVVPEPSAPPQERPQPQRSEPVPATPAPPVTSPATGSDHDSRSVRQATGDIGVAGSARPDRVSREAGPATESGGDAWSVLMAELAQRKDFIEEEWEERRRDVASQAHSQAQPGTGHGRRPVRDQAYLDSLIRTTVVSYPESSIESVHPAISYPDLRFLQYQLQAGICRVYYRVWIDAKGSIERSQLKTPSTREAQELYAPFIDAVRQGVATWPFDRREAEVHIDVLFEIE